MGWVVRDYILPFINLYRSLGRGFRAFALVESLWAFKFPLRGRRLVTLLADWSATSLYTTQCPARAQLPYTPSTVSGTGQSTKERQVVSHCDSFFSLPWPGTGLLIPSFLWWCISSAQIRVRETANDSVNLEDYVI